MAGFVKLVTATLGSLIRQAETEDILTCKDWTLLALAAAEGKTLSPVQLQKSLFLLGQKFGEELDAFYDFEPYHYGPFSKDIYNDLIRLVYEGNAVITFGRWKEYSATPDGLEVAKRLRESADADQVEYLHRVVNWARSLSFQTLVRSIYDKFPEYKSNSVFQD